ncbi:MAG: protein kinase [Pyrinomonadaceae bacterium]
MTKPDWQQVKDLFADALNRPADVRLEFLRDKCSGDQLLFDEVRSLLAASSETGNLIENNVIDLASKVGVTDADYTEQHFGNYRIIREIGSGGMGSVFLAERSDGEFSMQVALKLVRQSIAGSDVIARFKRERQILANLNHPNIAVLHDGGVSEKGEPFLAMEYVDGDSLVEYAANNRLCVKDKLRLFLRVCSAVSYAHRNLVVHRDLKPSNILVTNTGEPKLLDFGLAKAFESDLSTTQTGMRAFTPAYASPEQILGGNITTASDIYSLGVVFYELLAGCKPLNIDHKSFDEIISTINNVEPIPPSAVVDENDREASNQMLRGDLDTIALTALRKEPERRFKTVEDLAEDIKRHLAGRPISARPNTAGYLAGKFIRRNKIAASAAFLIIASLVTGLVFSLWQAEQARQERDRAERRFQDVRQLSNSLLFEISPTIERLPGSIQARELLVKRALEYLDSLAAESRSDIGLQSELALAYEQVGNLQGNIDRPNLSDFAGAIQSFEKAKTIRMLLPLNATDQFLLAQNLRITSSIRNRQNDIKGSLADAEQARSLFDGLLSANFDSPQFRLASIEAQFEHGQIYSYNNRYAEAIPRFRNALEALNGLDQEQPRARQLLAKGLAYLGNALSWDGQQTEAESEITTAIRVSEELGSQFPDDSEIQATLWQTYNLASSIYEDARPTMSLELADRALATAERASRRDDADSQAKYNLGRAYSRLGVISAKLNRISDAETNLRLSETILGSLIEREPKNTIYQRDLGKLYVRFGDTREKQDDPSGALSKYLASVAIFEELDEMDQLNTLAQRDLAQSLKSVGQMQIALGRPSEAKKTLRRSKTILDHLVENNAIGGFDRQLINDVEASLRSIPD